MTDPTPEALRFVDWLAHRNRDPELYRNCSTRKIVGWAVDRECHLREYRELLEAARWEWRSGFMGSPGAWFEINGTGKLTNAGYSNLLRAAIENVERKA